jgi:hypothetical protein
MIKLSDEQMAKLGIASFEDLEAKLGSAKSGDAQLKSFDAKLTDFNTRMEAMEAALESLPKVDAKAIVSDAVAQANASAETIAAKHVSAAVARAGQSGLAPNKPSTEGNDSTPKPAADDYKAQWEASENIRAEFITLKTYEAFMKADRDGRNVERASKPKQ